IAGLELAPSSDLVITDTNLGRTSTAISSNNNTSVKRVYTSTKLISEFIGTVVFNYDENDLNGLDENDLVLEVKSSDNTWSSYTGTVNTSNNTITYNFDSNISFNSITASQDGSTLTIENLDLLDGIYIYPNPTADRIYISSNEFLTAEIFNVVGQKILTTNNNDIDMTGLVSGTYALRITSNNNNSKTFKIIKK
ncbi:MAG: T9SS type A sorting domain-containing protein, partial [Hellea sp.]|nr:T9SS type A sorting domain-containing protein [Hellea sp.]